MAYRMVLISLLGLLSCSDAVAQSSTLFIRDLYIRYTGIEPSATQVDFWVRRMQSGTTAFEANYNILGSNYVFDLNQRDRVRYVTMAYQAVLSRAPQPRELSYWVNKLSLTNNDTIEFAKDFLRSQGSSVPPAIGGPPTVVPPADLPSRLYTMCLLLAQSLQQEYNGTNNWLLQNQTQSLTRTVQTNQWLLKNPGQNVSQFVSVCQSIDAALRSIRQVVTNDGYINPQTRSYLDQADQLIDTIKRSGPGQPVQPIVPPSIPSPDATQLRLVSLSRDLARETKQAAFQFRSRLGNTWNANMIIISAEGLASTTDQLKDLLEVQPLLKTARASLQSMYRQFVDLSDNVNRSVQDISCRQSWQEACNAYDQLASLAGVPPLGNTAPPPVVQLPSPGRPPVAFFNSIDRGMADCSRLVTSFTPYTYYHPSVTSLINELQTLRSQLAIIRQESEGIPQRSLMLSRAQKLQSILSRVMQFWRDAVMGSGITNPPTLTVLNASVQEVMNYLNRP
jgi:hypothetical protein